MITESLDKICNTKIEFKRSTYWKLAYYFLWYITHSKAWKLYSFSLLYRSWQLGLGDKNNE